MSVTYNPEARRAVTESLEHLHTVTINGQPVNVERGTLAFDESRSPHVTLSLTVTAPDDQATLDSWEPRLFTRVKVALGYKYQGGTIDLPDTADLSLTSRVVNRPDNTVDLVAESDEVILGEHGRTGTDLSLGQTYNPVSAITTLIRTALPNAVVRDVARRDGVTETQAVTLEVGADPMRLVADLADRGGDLWVHDDGLRVWQIRDRPTLGEAVATFSVGVQGTILASQTGLSREAWGNAVLVRHTWRDDAGVDRIVNGYAQVIGGPYAPATIGRRLFVVERDTPIDQSRATNSAGSILPRVFSRGRSVELDAIATYWVRPGDTVTVQLPVGAQERHLVAAVRFDITTGRMTLVTRQPTNAQIGA